MDLHGTTSAPKANVKRFFSIAGLMLLLLLVAAGGSTLWLATRTIDVSRFAPRIAAEIETVAPGLKLQLGPISARRDPLRGVVTVVIDKSAFNHPMLVHQATMQTLQVDLSLLAALQGRVEVKAVTAKGIEAEARFAFNDMFKAKDRPTSRALPWAPGLKSVRLSDVHLDLTDSQSARTVQIDVPSLAAYQNLFGGDVRLAGAADVRAGEGLLPITLRATATPDGPWHGDVRADMDHALALARALKPDLKLPESLPPMQLTATLRQQRTLRADIALDVRAGVVGWNYFYAQGLPIKRASLQARWQENQPTLSIPSATLLLDGTNLQASAALNLKKIEASFATAHFDQLTPKQLVALWPARFGGGGRPWIAANILAGSLRDGQFSLQAGAKVQLDFKMHDLVATYRTPMPPLVKAFGTGRLTEKGLILDLTQGQINELTVVPAQVVIEDWSVHPNMMRVDMAMRGELPKLLTVLDSNPLGFISRYGVVPLTTRGTADGRLALRFPLINALRTEEIDIKASAKTRSALVPDVFAGRAFNQADLDFVITSNGMVASGKGLVGPQPISLRWSEDFTGTKAAPSRYEIKAQSSVATLALLDIDLTGVASGPLDTEVNLDMKGPKMIGGQFRADARAASFDLPVFGRIKAPGVAAIVSGTMKQQGTQLLIEALSVQSTPVSLRGAARVPLAQGRAQFDIGQFTYGRNRLAGMVSFGNGGPVSLEIYGGTFDARPMLHGLNAAPPSATVVSPSSLRTEVKAKLDTVELLGDVTLQNLVADASVTGDVMTRLLATGKLGGASDARAELSGTTSGRVLTLNASDAGLMGRGLDLFKSGQGGVLDLVADIQGSAGALTMSGRGRVRNMRVTDTPVMARLLTLASLSGLRDTATGRGILFETIEVPFKVQHGIIDVKDARAIGPSLGLTLEGQVQQSLASMNLRGVIIPSYTLNAAIGKIPVLGTMLTGGKNQGLVGFNYRITGSATAPKVEVQTSSGLALGPLRLLFQGRAAKVAPEAK
jgi:hypothetical protein